MFRHGQRIVFIGDSITDRDRRDLQAPCGNGYVSLVRAFVTARYVRSKASRSSAVELGLRGGVSGQVTVKVAIIAMSSCSRLWQCMTYLPG
jgi:hypothetical protein